MPDIYQEHHKNRYLLGKKEKYPNIQKNIEEES